MGPLRVVVAAGSGRGPGFGETLGTGVEVVSIKFVKASAGQPQFPGGIQRGELLATMAGQEMTDQRSRQTID
jgi:hypothetical protein